MIPDDKNVGLLHNVRCCHENSSENVCIDTMHEVSAADPGPAHEQYTMTRSYR